MKKRLDLSIDLSLEQRYQREFIIKNKDSIILDVEVYNNKQPVVLDGNIARLYIKKSDDTIVVQGGTEELGDNTIAVSGNTLTIDVKNSATNVSGLCYGEIEIEGEDGIVATNSFVFEVVDRIGLADDAIKAVDDIYLIAEIEKFIIQAKKDMEEIRADIITLQGNVDKAIADFNAKVEETNSNINAKVEEATTAINTTKEEAINTITATKEETVNTVNTTKEEAINTINNTKNEATTAIDVKKEDTITTIEELKQSTVDAIKALEGEVIVKVDSVSEEHLNALKDAKDTHITEMESKKNEVIDSINAKEGELEETIAEASNTIQTIENVIATANTIKNTLDTSKAEATVINNTLNKLVETCNATKAELEAENVRAEANIETLQGLHPQSDVRIETLSRLIEEAKKYEEVVRAYIAKFEPAMDLTEVNQKLEELYKAVEMIQISFDNYYTKEEVDALLDGGFNGSIGVSTKFATMPVGLLDNVPEPPEIEGGEYIGKIVFKYEYLSTIGDKYKVIYLYNHQEKGYYPYLYLDESGSEMLIKCANASSSYTMKGFEKSLSGSSWSESNTFSIFYEERKTDVFYYSDFPVYSDINKTDIYRDASGASDYISNLDLADKTGKYYVKLSKSEYDSIQNVPALKLTKDLETILFCYKKDGRILQEITIEGITYTRVIRESWTGINTSNLVKKDVIGTIEGSTVAVYSEADDIFASCPVPNQHQNIVGQVDFKVDENKYCRIYTFKKSGNEMFYMTVSVSNVLLGSTANRYHFDRYLYADGAWKQDTSTYSYVSCKKAQFELYKNTLPICKGSNSTTYDKNVIIKEASSGDETIISDFNKATSFGVYNIAIKENTIALNAPVEGAFSGTLSCKVVKNKIHQLVKTVENDTYERMHNGESWTEWASGVDLSNYPTFDFVADNYYNKAEIDKAIKEAGVPFNGTIGVSSYPSVFATCPVPEKEAIGEIEAFSVYNKRYVKFYIHQNEDNSVDLNSIKVFYKYNNTYKIEFNTKIPYTAYYKTETGDWTLSTSSIACYFNTSNISQVRSLIYKNTFNLTDGSSVIEAKTGDDNLMGSYNSAIKTGTYKVSHTSKIEGAPKETVEGVLVVNKADNRIIQTLTENTGKVSTRYYDGAWTKWVGADDVGDISFAIKTEFATKNEYYPMWIFEPARNPEYPYRLTLTMGTKYGRIIDFKQDPTSYLKYDKSTNKLVCEEGYETLEMIHYYASDITRAPSSNDSTINWSTTTSATFYFTYVVLDWYNHNFDILDTEGNVYRKSEEFDTANITVDFNLATELSKYNVDINVDEEIVNKPANERIKGYMNVEKCATYIKQELITEDVVYTRLYSNSAWSEWKIEVNRDEFDSLNNQVQGLALPIPDKVNTFEYTNGDGMPEIYKWFDMNGFKVMWIDVKMSNAEYNMGSTGLIMKTLSIPAEAQIFNNIIMANITSYCREGENTLSRIVQNAEVVSNVSVRGRWRHTDNTYPKIDRFTIMCFGF